MIVSDKPEKQISGHRIKMYHVDKDSKVRSDVGESLFSDLVDSSYEQKFVWESKLRAKLLDGKFSSIEYFRTLQGMEIADLSSRTRIGIRKVKKHLSYNGFSSASVEELKRYASVFGVSTADFFNMTFIDDEGIVIREENNGQNLQILHVSLK